MVYIMTTFQPFVEVVIVQALQHEHYCAGCVQLLKQKNKFYDFHIQICLRTQNRTSLRNSNTKLVLNQLIANHHNCFCLVYQKHKINIYIWRSIQQYKFFNKNRWKECKIFDNWYDTTFGKPSQHYHFNFYFYGFHNNNMVGMSINCINGNWMVFLWHFDS